MTARQKARAGCYYFFGVVWCFVALAILATPAVAIVVLAVILVKAALIGAGVL